MIEKIILSISHSDDYPAPLITAIRRLPGRSSSGRYGYRIYNRMPVGAIEEEFDSPEYVLKVVR